MTRIKSLGFVAVKAKVAKLKEIAQKHLELGNISKIEDSLVLDIEEVEALIAEYDEIYARWLDALAREGF